jgi:hypothetical protein
MILAVVAVLVLVGVDYMEDSLKSLQRGVHQRTRGFRSKKRDESKGGNSEEGLQ